MNTTAHDPIDRQEPGEPRLPLMGRDVLAPGFSRLYAAVIEGHYDRAPGILEAIIRKAKTRTKRLHKDAQHAWSARAIADQMDAWFTENMKGDDTVNRINTLPTRDEETFRPAPTHAEIRAARPPQNPEDGQ